jgi:rhodanese-related sulfurtransferase
MRMSLSIPSRSIGEKSPYRSLTDIFPALLKPERAQIRKSRKIRTSQEFFFQDENFDFATACSASSHLQTNLVRTRFELTILRHKIALRSPLLAEWMENSIGTDSKSLRSCLGVKFSVMQYCAHGRASNRYVNVLHAAQTFSECTSRSGALWPTCISFTREVFARSPSSSLLETRGTGVSSHQPTISLKK